MDQQVAKAHIHSQRLFFLVAPEGPGKTFVTTAFQIFPKSKRKQLLAVVSAAVETQLLDGGHTAHSTLKISIPAHFVSTCTIDGDSQSARDLHKTQLIIWDKVVMTHRHNLE